VGYYLAKEMQGKIKDLTYDVYQELIMATAPVSSKACCQGLLQAHNTSMVNAYNIQGCNLVSGESIPTSFAWI
jgi:heterodisulfide reductase subunit B